MTQLTTCPSCGLQLLLAPEAPDTGPAECPHCQAEFALEEVVRKTLSFAKLQSVAEETHPATEVTPQRPRLSDTLGDLSLDSILGNQGEFEVGKAPASDQRNAETLASWESRLKRAMGESNPEAQNAPENVSPETPPSLDEPVPTAEENRAEADRPTEVPKFSYPTFDDPTFDDLEDEPDEDVSSELPAFVPAVGNAPSGEVGDELAGAEESVSDDAAVESDGRDEIQLDTTSRRKPKRRSTKRKVFSLAASLVLGAVGIPLGLYALLWIKGPAADHFQIAGYLPNSLLPPSMQTATSDEAPLANADNSTGRSAARNLLAGNLQAEPEEPESLAADTQPQEAAAPPVMRDDQVQVAAAELPTSEPPIIEAKTGAISAREFEELIDAAQLALPALVEGDLSTKENVARKGHAYMTLCHLAEKWSAVEVDDARRGRLADEAREVFASVARNSALQDDLALIASRWWSHDGRPTSGYFLVGRVERVELTDLGKIGFLAVGNASNSTTIPILWNELPGRPGDQIAVVGAIVVPTAEQVSMLPAGMEQVVVVHEAFRVE